jgi:hypothetical protein
MPKRRSLIVRPVNCLSSFLAPSLNAPFAFSVQERDGLSNGGGLRGLRGLVILFMPLSLRSSGTNFMLIHSIRKCWGASGAPRG